MVLPAAAVDKINGVRVLLLLRRFLQQVMNVVACVVAYEVLERSLKKSLYASITADGRANEAKSDIVLMFAVIFGFCFKPHF